MQGTRPQEDETSHRLLSGWGRTSPTAAWIARPSSAADVAGAIDRARSEGGHLLPRGLGRSYGDAAQCAGGRVLDMTGLAGVLDAQLDAPQGEGWVRAAAGTSLDALMRMLIPAGWFVPVTPGTRYVTVGGAIAADIHGKNHHRDGSFANHVRHMTLATPTGDVELTPRSDPDLFWATAGGMGLTGVVLDATISLVPIETAWMLVDTERARDLDECMAKMSERDAQYRYSVAWIDCMARGARLGRSVLTRGDHAKRDDLPLSLRKGARRFDPSIRLSVPFTAPPRLLNPLSVAAFNEMWFRKAPRSRVAHPESISSFFHPLDGVGDWNRLYGPRGFLQYQFVVPFGAEDDLRAVLEELSRNRVASFLAVLKRFGESDPGPLSFPAPGWTLALDIPASPGLGPLLDRLDEQVAAAGGRVYLAKDSRLRPVLFELMYPRLPQWMEVRERVDPTGLLSSDLSRRLGLDPLGHRHRSETGQRREDPPAKKRRGRHEPGHAVAGVGVLDQQSEKERVSTP